MRNSIVNIKDNNRFISRKRAGLYAGVTAGVTAVLTTGLTEFLPGGLTERVTAGVIAVYQQW